MTMPCDTVGPFNRLEISVNEMEATANTRLSSWELRERATGHLLASGLMPFDYKVIRLAAKEYYLNRLGDYILKTCAP